MSSIKDVEEVMKRVRHLCANIVDPDQTCYKYSFVTFFSNGNKFCVFLFTYLYADALPN